MKTCLKYGTEGLWVELPETSGFRGMLNPGEGTPIDDAPLAIWRSLAEPVASRPLHEIARGRKNACIVISDITRPVPNSVILPPIIKTLEAQGIGSEQILILVATGMHRPSTDQERERLVGKEIASRYRIQDHYSKRRQEMVEVGKINGTVPALVNRFYVESELKILTGFIEPHMWAGFSGGRKSILPGISSIDTLQYMHGPEMVAHPQCRYGTLDSNPFHEAGTEIMRLAGADFIVNVTLNSSKRITGVFSGHPVKAHRRGCEFLSQFCIRELSEPLDFIVTTNAGAPLDCNLYQTVKGITGAAKALKRRGDVLIASRCAEGLGTPEYKEVLDLADTPQNFLDRLMRKEFFIPDQWCAQEMYKVLVNHDVWIYTEGIPRDQLERYHLNPVADIASGVRGLLEKHGADARWAVVPDGPLVILKMP